MKWKKCHSHKCMSGLILIFTSILSHSTPNIHNNVDSKQPTRGKKSKRMDLKVIMRQITFLRSPFVDIGGYIFKDNTNTFFFPSSLKIRDAQSLSLTAPDSLSYVCPVFDAATKPTFKFVRRPSSVMWLKRQRLPTMHRALSDRHLNVRWPKREDVKMYKLNPFCFTEEFCQTIFDISEFL